MKKCRNGWHLYDGRGWGGICSYCILNLNHPTLRRANEFLRSARMEHGDRTLSDLPEARRSMPMRSRQRLAADYKQAASLLKEDLVWSGDFDGIRIDLADMIERFVVADIYPEPMTEIVQKLIADENDLSI